VKTLVSTDWHLDQTARSGVERWVSFEAQLARLERIIDQEKVDLFLHLGDLTDPDSGNRTIRALASTRRFLERIECRSVLLAGNHDVVDDSSHGVGARATVSVLAGLLVRVVETPATEVIGSKTILYLPYLSGAHAPEVEGRRLSAVEWLETSLRSTFAELSADAKVVVFCHLDIPGATTGSEGRMLRGGALELPRWMEEDPRVQRIYAGHVHKPQVVREKVQVVGSLDRLDFGEEMEPKGYVLLDL